MKLLFDENLSFRLCEAIGDVFPGSIHVRYVGMEEAHDRAIWEFAEGNGYTIVSQSLTEKAINGIAAFKFVIASEAKQSRAKSADWIASSQELLAMTSCMPDFVGCIFSQPLSSALFARLDG